MELTGAALFSVHSIFPSLTQFAWHPTAYIFFFVGRTRRLHQNLIKFVFAVMPVEAMLLWRAYPWPFGDLGCKLVTVASELVTHVSIFTMIVFTFERYFEKSFKVAEKDTNPCFKIHCHLLSFATGLALRKASICPYHNLHLDRRICSFGLLDLLHKGT